MEATVSERTVHTGYWYVPLPESTRGGQHVGTARGVLVYDEDLQMGILSFSERSQIKSVADANALLDLAIEVKPGARRAADLSSEDVSLLDELREELRANHGAWFCGTADICAVLDRLIAGAKP
jgi:hypothetical protein